eukprot:TRINITY_DN585_c0_g1_i1.p1 TRINITY_DN585_c0_g1~~TRINITY_DN585_c0_g1_i1.p1  ORF type:complete len:334 (-),score=19.10 TRINITY_DN585_c0_g1_i1:634-1635(-)
MRPNRFCCCRSRTIRCSCIVFTIFVVCFSTYLLLPGVTCYLYHAASPERSSSLSSYIFASQQPSSRSSAENSSSPFHRPPTIRYRFVNETQLSSNCKWKAKMTSREEPDFREPFVTLAVDFFRSLFENVGIVTVIRNGWLLGAVRYAKRIEWDLDGDVWMIVPADFSFACFYSIIQSFLSSNPKYERMEFRTFLAVEWVLYSDFERAILILTFDTPFRRALTFSVDIDVLSERLIFSDDSYNERHQTQYSLSPRNLFSSLCVCPFQNSMMHCLDSPGLENYLVTAYGIDYIRPQIGGSFTEVNFINRRYVWETQIGQALWKRFEYDLSSWFTH